jgi:Lrp/AsnC family transcriptional regulator, leucine-responsive regulatory protein
MFKNLNSKALDDLNWKILQELSDNARISSSEIGRRVGLSAPAVSERIQKMEDQGFIKGYLALVDLDKIGLTIQAFISFRSRTLKHDDMVKMAETLPPIFEWHSVTGDASMIFKVATSSSHELETVIQQLQEHGDTSTSLILSGDTDLNLLRKVFKSRGA